NFPATAKKAVVVPPDAPETQPSPRSTRNSKRIQKTAAAADPPAPLPTDGTQATSSSTSSQGTAGKQTALPGSKAAPKKGPPSRLKVNDPKAVQQDQTPSTGRVTTRSALAAPEPVPTTEVQVRPTTKSSSRKTSQQAPKRPPKKKESKPLPSEPDIGDGTANATQLEDTLARALQVRDADKTPAQRKSEAAAAARYAELYGGLSSMVALKAYCANMEKSFASEVLQRKPEYVLRRMALRTLVTGQPFSVSGKSLPSSASPQVNVSENGEDENGAPDNMDESDGDVSDTGSTVSDIFLPKKYYTGTKDRYDIGPEACNGVKTQYGKILDTRQLEDVFPLIAGDSPIDQQSKCVLFPLVSAWWFIRLGTYITDSEFDEFIAGCSMFGDVDEKLFLKFDLFDKEIFYLTASWLNFELASWFVRGASLRNLWTRRHLYSIRAFGYMATEWSRWTEATLREFNREQYEANLEKKRSQKSKEEMLDAPSSRHSSRSHVSELTPIPADLEDAPVSNDSDIIANQLQSDLKTTDANPPSEDPAPALASSAVPTASKKRKGISREMASLGVSPSDLVELDGPRKRRSRAA
ncbi:hypothetical protein BJ508DRAFT_316343, partial [Ascobolus immersus RN42]